VEGYINGYNKVMLLHKIVWKVSIMVIIWLCYINTRIGQIEIQIINILPPLMAGNSNILPTLFAGKSNCSRLIMVTTLFGSNSWREIQIAPVR
jgi:hypothetical protein